jgi:peptide chain release factor 2
LIKEVSILEEQASNQEFWNNLENSQKILQKTKELKDSIKEFENLKSKYDDLVVLTDLALETGDESVTVEVAEGLKDLKKQLDNVRIATLLDGQYDRNNAILTLHPGAGGTESQDWASMLLRMYTRWGESKNYSVKILDYLEGEEAGLKSVTILISGTNAYGYLRSEKGVHRLVRISPFDASGRRHTSFASTEVMPEINEDIAVDIKTEDLKVDTYRSSGAGGQHVNKTESAVRITHIPSGIVVQCQSERSQIQNRETAMKMLRSKLFEKMEREQQQKIQGIKGEQKDIAWGSQIRSYVFHPYTLVKDHRTGYEVGNINAVMDGDIDGFINAFLNS